jgi:hypothetical protein
MDNTLNLTLSTWAMKIIPAIPEHRRLCIIIIYHEPGIEHRRCSIIAELNIVDLASL